MRVFSALAVYPSLIGGAEGAGGAVGADLIQVLPLVLRHHRKDFSLPGCGAGDHGGIGVQAPISPCLVRECRHALPAQSIHKGGNALVHTPSHSLLCRHLLQTDTPVNVRLSPTQKGALQSGKRPHVPVHQLTHEVHRELLHDIRLGAGKALGVGVAAQVLFHGLAGNRPGFRVMDVKLRLDHAGHILPFIRFQLSENLLHPFQRGHGVIIHKTAAAQAADLVDNVRLRLEVQPDEALQFPLRGCTGKSRHILLALLSIFPRLFCQQPRQRVAQGGHVLVGLALLCGDQFVCQGAEQAGLVLQFLELTHCHICVQKPGLKRRNDDIGLFLGDCRRLAGSGCPQRRERYIKVELLNACAAGHYRKHLVQNGPQFAFPQGVHVVVVVFQVTFAGCVHARRGTAKQLGHGVVGRTAQVQAHALVHVRQASKGVLGVVDLISLLHQLHSEIGTQDFLGLHGVPETPLHIRAGHGEQLLQALYLHGVDVRLEGQSGHVGAYVVVCYHVIIERFHLGLAPVKLRLPFQIGELPAHEPHKAGVMDTGGSMPGGIVDAVVLRHKLPALKGQTCIRADSLPAVEDVQPPEAAGKNSFCIQRAGKVLLPVNEDKPGGTAIQAAPFQASAHAVPEPGGALHSLDRLSLLRCGALEVVPLSQHIVHEQAHNVLHHPVAAVQAVQQGVIVCHPGQRVFRRFQRALGAVPQREQRVGKCVQRGRHRFFCAPGGAVFVTSGHVQTSNRAVS
nr:MAG TPA: hypothetical protein [Caudoviricetes sp.]